MSKFLSKIVNPAWTNIKAFMKSPGFREKLSAIRRKKLLDPSISVAQEIKELLEEEENKK